MMDRKQTLEINAEELAAIEAALHTQSKILNVQASAGGIEAHDQLNQVKRALARVTQIKPRASGTPPRGWGLGWFGKAGLFS